jgi:uncharacterized protein
LRWIAYLWSRFRDRPATVTTGGPCEKCGRPAVVFDYRANPDQPLSERRYCEACARKALWIPTPAREGAANGRVATPAEVAVVVERIIVSTSEKQHLLVFREVGGPRRLSFFTGWVEATSLWWALKEESCARPLTHEAWVASVAALGGAIQSACVHTRREDTYFAELRLLRDAVPVAIDMRPSDALLVALRAGVPFLFAESLLAADAVTEPEPAE